MTNHSEMGLSSIINDKGHFLVNEEAKLALLLYEDYECENCGKAFVELKAMHEYFKEKIRIVYRHFLCTSIHPSALSSDLPTQLSLEGNKSNSLFTGQRLIVGKEQISSSRLVLLNKPNDNEE